jgi:hypothetical protein
MDRRQTTTARTLRRPLICLPTVALVLSASDIAAALCDATGVSDDQLRWATGLLIVAVTQLEAVLLTHRLGFG